MTRRAVVSMPDILTITLNPTVDVSTKVARLVPGHKLRCAQERRDAGGGGINVARVVRRLGGEVMACFPVGGQIGSLLQRLLAQEGVPSTTIPIRGDTRESFTALEEATGSEYRFVLPGPRLDEDEFQSITDALTALAQQSQFVVCSGSLPPGAPENAYGALADLARRENAKFVLDASGAALRAGLVHGVYLVKPSLRELQELVGRELQNEAEILAAARVLIVSKQAEIVVVTLGARGALLVTQDGAFAAEALPIAVTSSVGAGDSFLGGMVWAIAAGRGLDRAFRYGIAAGASSLMLPGTQLCQRADVMGLVGSVRVRQLAN